MTNHLARRVVARTLRVDPESIQKLRKEFLALAKNIPRAKDDKDLAKLKDAFKTFRVRFDRIFFEEWLNRQFKYDDNIRNKSWHEKELREKGWTFYLELSFPGRFWGEQKRWHQRLQTKARPLWKALQDFVKDNEGAYDIQTTDVSQMDLEGFKVRLIGDPNAGYSSDHGGIERFREALRIFKGRASKVLPLMLKAMLPLHVLVDAGLDAEGSYHRRYLEISLRGSEKNPRRTSHVIAHEMGHHLYKNYLSGKDRKFWDAAVSGNYAPMTPEDIEKALKLWPKGAWTHEMPELLKDVDPTLAIQLQLIGWGHQGRRGMSTREDFEAALERGTVLSVPKNPITGYSGKNSEEAFCEAVGLLVAYGPRAVDDLVLSWLRMVLPSLKIASAEAALRVAARYKEKKKVPSQDGGETTVYVYSERQIADRNRKKAERVAQLGKSIKKLRAQVKKDLKSSDPATKLTALAVALMDHTYERVGNPQSAKDGHFGVTGWQKKHVSFGSGGAKIKYVGKSGVEQEKTITDTSIKKALKDSYGSLKKDSDCVLSWDGGCVTASDVNKYLKPFGATAKDIRGYHANDEMKSRLKKVRSGKLPEDTKEREKLLKDEFKKALEETAKAVGHEASTLRSQYLIPGLEDSYLKDGGVVTASKKEAARPIPLDKTALLNQAKVVAKELSVALKRRYPQDAPLGSLNLPKYVMKTGLSELGAWVNVKGDPVGLITLVVVSEPSANAKFILDGAFGKAGGSPLIVITLNGKYTVETLAGLSLEKDIYSLLVHEMTHALDYNRKRKSLSNRIPAPGVVDLDSYYNDPAEVKAYMQEVVEHALSVAPKLSRVFKGPKLVQVILQNSQVLKDIESYLSSSNRNKIFKAVYTALEEAGHLAE